MTAVDSKLPLDKLLKPASIAIVGASIRPQSYGAMVQGMLTRHRYPGSLYLINPRYEDIDGLPCYPDLESVPGPIDMVYIALPSSAVVEVLERAGQIGVGGAVIPGSGFADGGADGIALQAQLVETAARYGIAICGPNNMGYINYHARTASWPTFVPEIVAPSDIALVTQSGSVGIAISQDGRGLNLAIMVGSGNEANVGAAEYLDYFVRDDDINVVLMFLETIRNPAGFAAAAEEARRRGKRIAVVKVGRSDTASRMVSAHTGAIAGEDKVYDAFFRKHGVLRAVDMDELVELGALLSAAPQPPASSTLAPVTLSGGEAALVADLCGDLGMQIPDLEERTIERLRAEFPPFGTPRNPIDAYGLGWDAERFHRIVEAVVDDENIGLIPLCMDSASNGDGDHGMVEQMAATCKALDPLTDKRFVYINNTSGSGVSESARREFGDGKIPVLVGMRAGLGAVSQWLRLVEPEPTAIVEVDNSWVDKALQAKGEAQRLALLESAGVSMVPTTVVRSTEEACAAAHNHDAVVMKGTAESMLHKTEHGLVVLGLSGDDAVADAYERLSVSLEELTPDDPTRAVLLQPMLGEGVELIVGAHHVPGFGTVVAVGPGGTLVEVVKQASVRLAPFGPEVAHQMLKETVAAQLLAGVRGRGPFDVEAASEAIASFSLFAAGCGDRLKAIEVNPLLVRPAGAGVCGLDAVFER